MEDISFEGQIETLRPRYEIFGLLGRTSAVDEYVETFSSAVRAQQV